ncbi:odorant receptor Or2-like [Schistocerca nitens]|uniref:odorant receptor Or2-like n=1 Tax=Schistocerca nitens TaxID=7011 RepID=UPI002119B01C|nr:odorant receptor Or2-like [Schistocerca nitens]
MKSDDSVYDELCRCIECHQEIIRLVNYMGKLMSPVAMTQFMSGVMVACWTLFQATYSPDDTTVYKCAAWLPTPTLQIFMYCWGGHSIMEKAEELSQAAYNSAWVDRAANFKSSMRVLMCRGQKPLLLNAGGIYPVNRASFVSLMNAAYSYYTLLRQLNGR